MNWAFRLILASLMLSVIGTTSFGAENWGSPGEFVEHFQYPFIDLAAIHMNPAFTPAVDQKQVSINGQMLFEGTNFFYLSYNWPIYTSLLYPRRGYSTLTFTLLGLNTPDIEARDYANRIEGTYSDMEMLFLVGYGHKLLEGVSIGANLKLFMHNAGKLINEDDEFADASATGFGADAGAAYELPDKSFMVGATIQNLIPPAPQLDQEKDAWPINLKLDAKYVTFADRLILTAGADVNDLVSSADNFQDGSVIASHLRFGSLYRISEDFTVHAGWNETHVLTGLHYKSNSGKDTGPHTQIGATVAYHLNGLGMNYRASVDYMWGITREEYIRKLLEKLPWELWNKAMALYQAEQYWDASQIFGEIVVRFPWFEKADASLFYVGKCLYARQMPRGAEQVHKKLFKEFPKSEYTSKSLFELQNIYYHVGNFDAAESMYSKIYEYFRSSDIIDGSNYVHGMTKLLKNDNDEAIRLFSTVSAESEYYSYARYSTALAYMNKNDLKTAKSTLSDVIGRVPSNESEKKFIEKVMVALGHLTFELGQFADAVDAYSRVPADSKFYVDALFGKGWSNLKLNQWQNALNAFDEVVRLAPEGKFSNEAMFLSGICYERLEQNETALKMYEQVKSIASKRIPVIEENRIPEIITEEQTSIKDRREGFSRTEYQAVEVLLRKPDRQRDEEALALKTQINDWLVDLNNAIKNLEEFQVDVKIRMTNQELVRKADIQMSNLKLKLSQSQDQNLFKQIQEQQ